MEKPLVEYNTLKKINKENQLMLSFVFEDYLRMPFNISDIKFSQYFAVMSFDFQMLDKQSVEGALFVLLNYSILQSFLQKNLRQRVTGELLLLKKPKALLEFANNPDCPKIAALLFQNK